MDSLLYNNTILLEIAEEQAAALSSQARSLQTLEQKLNIESQLSAQTKELQLVKDKAAQQSESITALTKTITSFFDDYKKGEEIRLKNKEDRRLRKQTAREQALKEAAEQRQRMMEQAAKELEEMKRLAAQELASQMQ